MTFRQGGVWQETPDEAGREARESTVRHGEEWQVGMSGNPQAKGLNTLCPGVPTRGPTWGAVQTHFVRRALQRGQPAPHTAEALAEARLLNLQQLLQLADGREDLLLVETVLGTERSPPPPPTTAGSLALGFQSHPEPWPKG